MLTSLFPRGKKGAILPDMGGEVLSVQLHSKPILAMCESSSDSYGTMICTSSNDGTIKTIYNSDEVWSISGYYAFSLYYHNHDIYAGCSDGMIRKIPWYGSGISDFYQAHSKGIYDLDISYVDSYTDIIYTASSDNSVKKIKDDFHAGISEVWSFTGHTSAVNSISLARGYIYSGSSDKTVRKISPDGVEIWSFTGHNSPVLSVEHSVYGVYSSGTGSIIEIDDDGNELWRFKEIETRIPSLSLSNVNYTLAAASYDRTIRKIFNGEEEWRYVGISPASTVLYHDDGCIYSGFENGTVVKLSPSNAGVLYYTSDYSLTPITCKSIKKSGTKYTIRI